MKPRLQPQGLAALLALFAVSAVASETVIIRYVAEEVHPFEIAFFRSLFSVFFVAPWVMSRGRRALQTNHWNVHIARALLKLAAMVTYFYALSLVPLALVTSISFSKPLFIALGGMLVLHEPALRSRILAVIIGFLGVVIVLRPSSGLDNPLIVFAIVSTIGQAAVGMIMKYLSDRETPSQLLAINIVLTVPAALLISLPVWTTPSLPILGLLVVQAAIGASTQLAMSKAMSLSDVSAIAPIEFVRLPIVMALGFLIFSEPIDLLTLVGGAVIFAASLLPSLGRRRNGVEF